MKVKRIIGFIAAGAVIASSFTGVFASEIADKTDDSYEGVVWQAIDDGREFGNSSNILTSELCDEPDYTADGVASAKIEWVSTILNSDGSVSKNVQIQLASNEIPKLQGKTVRSVSVDVFVPEELENGDENPAVGSKLYGYGVTADGLEMNGFYDKSSPRELITGEWQTVTFDVTNCITFPFMIWEVVSENPIGSTIYLDNLILYYHTPTSVFDSFENYKEDWKAGGYPLSQNTDSVYVKDGNGSLKIDGTSKTGEDYVLRSTLLNVPNVRGRQIPQIKGYTAKTFGFWAYSDTAAGYFKPLGSESRQYVKAGEWTYLSWNIPASNGTWNWTVDHFGQMVLNVTTAGNIYIDAMSIGYQNDSETVLDGFESFLWTSGGCYGASGYGLNTDQNYVKDGNGSGKFVIPAKKGFDDGEYVYTNNGFGVNVPSAPEGKVLKKIGMWVYGTNTEGTYLRPTLRTDTNNFYRPFGNIDLNFEGWKYIEAEVDSKVTKFYNIQIQNTTDTDSIFYIDKISAVYEDLAVLSTQLKNGDAELDLQYVEAGDIIKYEVMLNKTTEMNYPVLVLIGGYDADGALIKARTATVGKDENGEIIKSAAINIASSEEAAGLDSVRGFVFNGSTLEPISVTKKRHKE